MSSDSLILALPKGRVFESFKPLLDGTNFQLKIEKDRSRKILIDTKSKSLKILLIRGWDIPTYVNAGAAHLGVVGKDILLEKSSEEFIELLDLKIARCRLCLAGKRHILETSGKMRIATKYPTVSIEFMKSLGIQAEIFYLHGSQEVAPMLGLSDGIVDLVDSGKTLNDNGLKEIKVIKNISARLISNKAALKTKGNLITELKETLLSKI